MRTAVKKVQKAARSAKTTTTKLPTLSYKDVQIIFLSDGLERIEALISAGAISKGMLRRAAAEFSGNKVAQSFVDFVKARVGDTRRGRRAPATGDTRKYRAQQIGDGNLFIRLPVSGLVKGKGGTVAVSFLSDRITVKAE